MTDRRKHGRRALALFPEKFRLELVRKNVKIDPNWSSPSVEIKIGNEESELECAYKLLHNNYVNAGFMNPDPTGMRVLPQHLLPQTTTIVAKWDGKVIGTISMIRDNPFGLPLEKIFNVDDRREGGRRLIEVSSLAVDPLFRGQINQILLPLFRYVYQYAYYCFGGHELVIAVNPSMVDLYLGILCFEKLKGKAKPYDFVKGAPAVGLFLNMETSVERWRQTFAHRPITGNFYKYWTEFPHNPKIHVPVRHYHSASDPVLTPQLLSDFFLGRAQLARKLSHRELQVLLDAYPSPEFQKVLLPLQSIISRKSVRLETQMRALVGPAQLPGEVLNVSRDGLLLRMKEGCLTIGQQAHLDIWLTKDSSTRIKAEVRWCPHKNLIGLHILDTTAEWQLMVDTLERDHKIFSRDLKLVA